MAAPPEPHVVGDDLFPQRREGSSQKKGVGGIEQKNENLSVLFYLLVSQHTYPHACTSETLSLNLIHCSIIHSLPRGRWSAIILSYYDEFQGRDL